LKVLKDFNFVFIPSFQALLYIFLPVEVEKPFLGIYKKCIACGFIFYVCKFLYCNLVCCSKFSGAKA